MLRDGDVIWYNFSTMKINTLLVVAALALAGCTTANSTKSLCGANSNDPVIGNWSLDLGLDFMPAASMIVSRDSSGTPQALVLWRWASPLYMKNVKICGNKFSFEHPWGRKVCGFVQGCTLTAVAKRMDGTVEASITGRRNPEICSGVDTKNAKLGEGIDLLKNGLSDWVAMSSSGQMGWKITEEGGQKILSNKLARDSKGKIEIGGVNIKTKRADFYDFNLEYDVRVPPNANSGVYLRGRFEIQVVDSFGKEVDSHNMAAYYGRVAPKVAVEKKPGEWQHVSVTLYKRHLTVVLNGTTIIENAPVVGVTGGAIDANLFAAGPIYLQGDHSDADFKNMILRPVID